MSTLYRNLYVEGLTSLKYNLTVNFLLLTLSFDLKIERILANFTISADGYLDARPFRPETIPSGNLTAVNQIAAISASGVHIAGRANIFQNLQIPNITINSLSFEAFEFDTATLDFGEMEIGGQTHDWSEISKNLKENFDQDFIDNKDIITNNIRLAALNKVKVSDIQYLRNRLLIKSIAHF